MATGEANWGRTSAPHRERRTLAAAALRLASGWLASWASRLAAGERAHDEHSGGSRVLEFYAEAGAPEGALYVDGVLVGRVTGVDRL